MFNVYVDADSFPSCLLPMVLKRLVKEREYIQDAVFVSDRVIPLVRNTIEGDTHSLRLEKEGVMGKDELRRIKSHLSYIVVEPGPDSADNMICEIAERPGFVITHDVPLSSRVVEKGLDALDDRGHIYTTENIRERLSERNFFTSLRECGLESTKTKKLDAGDMNAFASSFDRLIEKYKKSRP